MLYGWNAFVLLHFVLLGFELQELKELQELQELQEPQELEELQEPQELLDFVGSPSDEPPFREPRIIAPGCLSLPYVHPT